MSERDNSYKPTHPQTMSLEYRGIASDIMELDAATADGFMRISDMRLNVIITKKKPNRTREYDQLGSVKVAKTLGVPSLTLWRGDIIPLRSVKKTTHGSLWLMIKPLFKEYPMPAMLGRNLTPYL